MKRIILALALFAGSMMAYAQSEVKNDTIAVINSQIKKVVQDETTNTKGKKVVKYYILYNGALVPTSKSVVETYNLCLKHNAECALAMVINKRTNKKRIILN